MLRLVLAVAAAIALAGCGGESDEEGVREAVYDYLSAFADQDGERVCGLLTEASREAIGGSECAKYLERTFDQDAEAVERVGRDVLALPNVTIRGDRATFSPESQPVDLEKVDGEWLIDQR